jgi:hypothetical protein
MRAKNKGGLDDENKEDMLVALSNLQFMNSLNP